MSRFTDAEAQFLDGQRLGRLATLGPEGGPQCRPVGFRLNREFGTVDIGGYDLARTRKYRNIQADPRVSFVVDDLESIDPWRPRGVEIRGTAEALESESFGGRVGPLIRVRPIRILAWGLGSPDHPSPG
ncbi:PPOX class F420-dependent oxidoreductase [Rhodococcus triatomae]|uniref:Pyridoxamine 5'-phosphate oxidase family protein n=1 Tax=Rhodococcus triatomae TaxID=300028 RepID=A0A1G8NZL2_9NOCA|nr:PPOX class F420-dependent oxidoreductase [Rhodococcus triatomae]QNG18790.1 PPOX class F420-dependent oxidoreductase [Rhodococcus triatomae]QNG25299.1 PPOX class F420-dependent oxidoreductase [Rhodococcus triatomae]SDI85649.1 pyridoxamine 5'-phosphate oxidase family protein [Rhodococcus triatomae]